MTEGKRYRVVQWATGNIGSWSLRGVIEHPLLDLVGVHVFSDDKAGRDAGELAGVGPIGVSATNRLEDVIALKPDCVLYMPQYTDLDALCALLEAGINVVTTRTDFHNPGHMNPETRERIDAACARGGASLHSTGSSPGFITEAVPLVLSSIERRLDGIWIDEFADLSKRDSPQLLFDVMGFGREPRPVGEGHLWHIRESFGPSLRLVAEALGLPLDDLVVEGELALASERVEIAAGVIEKGTLAGQRFTLRGMHKGRELLRMRPTWYCTSRIDADWELQDTGWRIKLAGDSPLDITMRFDAPLERMAEISPGFTANRAINAVPYVCDAAPGIRTSLELPQIVAKFG